MAPFGARRYSLGEYLNLKQKIFSAILKDLSHWHFAEIPYYREKDSFGDMDILVRTPFKSGDYEVFRKALNVEHFVMNSGVMSCLVDELQIDIIPMPAEDFDSALVYYSFNDLGNLMGKIFHKFGLKYGHRGLTLPLRDGDHEFKELTISKDYRRIFEFIGLDWVRFVQGFNNLKEIYDFVKGSKYFTPSLFAYESLNHTNRIRDRKRSTYHGFLEYIKEEEERYIFHEDKSKYLLTILDFFPGAKEPYMKAVHDLEYKRRVRAHYNGNLISGWTGLSGSILGKFIQSLRSRHGEFETWVLKLRTDELKELTIREAIEFDGERSIGKFGYISQLKPELRNASSVRQLQQD